MAACCNEQRFASDSVRPLSGIVLVVATLLGQRRFADVDQSVYCDEGEQSEPKKGLLHRDTRGRGRKICIA
jgi:hypothetical protein